MKKLLSGSGLAALLATVIASPANAQCPGNSTNDPCQNMGCNNVVNFDNSTLDAIANCGQINISGATLFRNFFNSLAATNDFIDVDGDGFAGFDPMTPPFVDQLAGDFANPLSTCWLVNVRSVGSTNGVRELIDSQLCGCVEIDPPSEQGIANRLVYADGGIVQPDGFCDVNPSGTPVCIEEVQASIADIPLIWSTRQDDTSGNVWDRTPGLTGYGFNPIPSSTGFILPLSPLSRNCDGATNGTVTLNTDTGNPDANTVYDTSVAWGPIGYIANRRTGVEDFRISEAQHLFVAGRMPNGENLIGTTRSNGSGTRNAQMNTSGIDPAWGRGDNIGDELNDRTFANVGPGTQATNCGGSSIMETAVQSRGLSIGYTGLSGGSRSVADSRAGRYELLNVIFDDRGGNMPVRPSVDAVLDNGDPNSGWQLGGAVTFSTRGNPEQLDTMAPDYMGGTRQPTAAFLRNISASVAAFAGDPGTIEDLNMPGEFLATTFFLLGGIDAQPNLADPAQFVASNPNQTLQDFIRANNNFGAGGDPFPYGSVNPAGLVPTRLAFPALENGPTAYSDGSTDGSYADFNGNFTVSAGLDLNERNQLQGDFDNDGDRDIDDLDEMVAAVNDPRGFVIAEGMSGGNAGDLAGDYVIPEIIGDHNGDGDLDAEDVRYAADGLALVADSLDRRVGFIAVDNAAVALRGGSANYFGTVLVTGTYDAGDSRADVAGSVDGPTAGAQPLGADGMVDCDDIAHVQENFGDWSDLNQAVFMDLSCDMNGDLLVNADDVLEIVVNILDSACGDVNLDGVVDATDSGIIMSNMGQAGNWCDGDINSDGVVDQADMDAFNSGDCGGVKGCPVATCGDANCDGSVTVSDIGFFVTAVAQGEAAWNAAFPGGTAPCDFTCANDTNGDGSVTVGDIGFFVNAVTAGAPCN